MTQLPGGRVPEARPRLLFLCHTLPYPLDAGVWLRTYNLIRQLSKAFDLTILCFERVVPGGQSADDIAEATRELQRFGRVQVFPLPEVHSRWRKIQVHLQSVFRRRVFTVYRHHTPAFAAAVHDAVRSGEYDLIHLDSLDLSGVLPVETTAPIVCVHHNVESKLLQRRAEAERGLLRAYFRLQATLQRQEEQRWCGSFAMNMMVSEGDSADLEAIAPTAKRCVVPNGVDLEYFHAAPLGPGKRLVFVGGLNWYPNRDGFEYFASAIVPRVRKVHPDVEIDWIGTGAELVSASTAAQAGIRLTGRVPDVRPLVHAAQCFVVPLRVGGGSRLKILDAWAMGKAVVSTSVGCEGLAAIDDANIVIADDPQSFADAISRLLENASLAERIGREGRRTAESLYSWHSLGQVLRNQYLGLLQQANSPE